MGNRGKMAFMATWEPTALAFLRGQFGAFCTPLDRVGPSLASLAKVLLLALGALAVGLPAPAAVPASGVLTGSGSPVTWSGGPFTAAANDPSACTVLNCDTFYFTLNTPSGFFSGHHGVQLRIAWSERASELDLYLFDAGGNLLASAVQSSESYEEIEAGPLANGTYKLVIVAAQTLNASYQGSARIAQDPAFADGKARYQPGDMIFAEPFKLPRPVDNTTSTPLLDQHLEPRVVHDPLGNLYVAAMRGLPGVVDLWKSYDTGKTFTYLGAPDGVQDLATRATAGLGASGQDLAVGTSGNVYMNLLWQGFTTQASSFNGGSSWVVNPLSRDIPAGGRQWIAAAANNTVYLTYKQGESVPEERARMVVAKSTDGGITFPEVRPVIAPEIGVQPGEQGNLVVDPASGNIYNIFFDRAGSRIYLARSTDEGIRFELLVVYQGPAETSKAHLFPSIAVDSGGHLHAVFSDGQNTYLTTSQDAGTTWSHVVRVNNGSATRTAIQPWVMAGDPGKVDITWLGSAVRDHLDNSAEWRVFMAQSQDDLASVPTFAQTAVTGVIHSGPLCVNGSECAEYWVPDVYLDGSALIVYPDDMNSRLPSEATRAWFVRQTAGPRIIHTVQ